MPLTGSSTILIKPCYDGRTLPGIQHVAGDGLSAISIKESHRNCKFMHDPESNQPRISCAQGIKARNSFWNLHRPDLRKVKGLDCATTESVTQVFQAHNTQNAGKPTYKKKMLRMLGSLVTKKSKAPVRPEVLMRNGPWPVNTCVLSTICREKELKQDGGLNNLSLNGGETRLSTELIEPKALNTSRASQSLLSQLPTSDTVYISLPSPGMLTMSSDNAFVVFTEPLKPFNSGNKPANAVPVFKNAHSLLESEVSSSNQTVPSSLRLESKRSLAHIPDSWHPGYCDENEFIYGMGQNDEVNGSVNKTTLSDSSDERVTKCVSADSGSFNLECNSEARLQSAQEKSLDQAAEAAQSIVRDLIEEMQEIDKYMSSYISSFCAREEEFPNSPILQQISNTVLNSLGQKKCPIKLNRNQENTNMNTPSVAAGSTHLTSKVYNQIAEHSQSQCVQEEEHKSLQEVIITGDNKTTLCTLQKDSERFRIPSRGRAEIDNELKEDPLPGYCYWEYDISLDPLDNQQSISDYTSNSSTTGHSDLFTKKNTSLIPLSLFENTWKEFIKGISKHGSFVKPTDESQGLDPLQSSTVENDTPNYYQWASMYDRSIIEEAEIVVHTIDHFLNSVCFIEQDGTAFAHRPTNVTIVEIDDNYELHSSSKQDDSFRQNVHNNSQEHMDCQLEECESNTAKTFSKDNTQSQFKNDNVQQNICINNQQSMDVQLEESQAETFNKLNIQLQSENKQSLLDVQEKYDLKSILVDNYKTGSVFIDNNSADSIANIDESKLTFGLKDTVVVKEENLIDSVNSKNILSNVRTDVNSSNKESRGNLEKYKQPSFDIQDKDDLKSFSLENYKTDTVYMESDSASHIENVDESKQTFGLKDTMVKEENLLNSVNLMNVWSTLSIMELNHKTNINSNKKESRTKLKEYKQPSNVQVLDSTEVATHSMNGEQDAFSCRPLADNICDDNIMSSFEQLCSSAEQIVQENISRRYAASGKGISSCNVARQISTISTNIVSDEKYSLLDIQEKDSNSGRSKYVKIPVKRNNSSNNADSQFIFSSPNVQLNLTNPLLGVNKK